MSNARAIFSRNVDLLNNTEAVIVVAMEYVRSHKREHGHDVVQDRCWRNTGEAGNKQQRLVERLRTLGC